MSLDKQHNPSIPISIREWIVCFTSAFTLVATAWSLGGYKNWALSLLLIEHELLLSEHTANDSFLEW